MKNLSIISQEQVSENQVIRLSVARTQQPNAERLISKIIFYLHLDGGHGEGFATESSENFIKMIEIIKKLSKSK